MICLTIFDLPEVDKEKEEDRNVEQHEPQRSADDINVLKYENNRLKEENEKLQDKLNQNKDKDKDNKN